MNGEKVECEGDLLSAIEARADGKTVDVKIWRKCEKRLADNVGVKLTSSQKGKAG